MKEQKLRQVIREEIRRVDEAGRSDDMNALIDKAAERFEAMDATRARQELIGRLGWESYAGTLRFVDRHWNVLDEEVPESGFHKPDTRDKIVRLTDRMMRALGKDDFVMEVLKASSKDELKALASR